MKASVLRDREATHKLRPATHAVYFAFRPSISDILTTLNGARRLEVIYMPKAYEKTMGNTVKTLAKNYKVSIVVPIETIQGMRLDIVNDEIEIDNNGNITIPEQEEK